MKVITLWQPWATWVVLGWKTIETRLHPRFASLAGQVIGIHAGLKFDDLAMDTDDLIAHKSPAGFHDGIEIGVYDLVETARVKSLLLDRTPHKRLNKDEGRSS